MIYAWVSFICCSYFFFASIPLPRIERTNQSIDTQQYTNITATIKMSERSKKKKKIVLIFIMNLLFFNTSLFFIHSFRIYATTRFNLTLNDFEIMEMVSRIRWFIVTDHREWNKTDRDEKKTRTQNRNFVGFCVNFMALDVWSLFSRSAALPIKIWI